MQAARWIILKAGVSPGRGEIEGQGLRVNGKGSKRTRVAGMRGQDGGWWVVGGGWWMVGGGWWVAVQTKLSFGFFVFMLTPNVKFQGRS